ncbi:hypothetical protein KGA66_01310 [Actinocrinis puniceicyclus]|uniref:DUF3592 domain-containing protein n=1 Tax=Actinocrinis puniceicyclus TaxID=977794 RepID=A0A8J7WG81_9ACTN|nr:hypothetical protein [Actinocrinis puniceicyclus]MBS2961666.1 hypothetical protein [Actinocrinis puniceicyclus]
MAAGHVAAFVIAAGASIVTAVAGALMCGSQFTRSRRLLQRGSHVTARVVEAIPRHPAGQAFPSDAARIVVEYEIGATTHRETIVLARTSQDSYHVGDELEVMAGCGRPPHVRTDEEPNIAYGTIEQIAGAVLVILAALPLFIMLSVHALTP